MFSIYCKQQNKGITTIELLFAIAIFALSFVSILSVLQTNTKLMTQNKAKIAAIALSDRYTEYIHALPYDDIGLPGQNPSGIISATHNHNYAGVNFIVHNSVVWVDNPKDGLSSSDFDSNPNDYKQIKTVITWSLHGKQYSYKRINNIYAPF